MKRSTSFKAAFCSTHGEYYRRGPTDLCPGCVREQRVAALEDARARAVLAASQLTGNDVVATRAVMHDAEWKALRDQRE
jgi:hypothetical protein